MPENNQTNTSLIDDTQAPKVPTQDALVADETDAGPTSNEFMQKVASKISDAHNVLVALSSDPSVDEIAAAIGLSLFLDKLGKRATAIYSGSTPNALEFLKPEETFDKTADTLQDFVIALNKEKADHLRYKLDGDYVKIYITPYRSRIAEEDLEFSYGDFNIDLVLALNVSNGVDLDSALREHGRIMHDASVINITTGNPGKFGEIEWSDKSASSVSEMAAKLIYFVGGKTKLQPEEATAFLTGIVAATDRFSKGNTTSETMKVASDLMESGADQQLIAKNITTDINNQVFSLSNAERPNDDPTMLDINHGVEMDETLEEEEPEKVEEVSEKIAEEPEKDPLLEELKATEASLANAGAETVAEKKDEPVRIDDSPILCEPSLPMLPTLDEPTIAPSAPSNLGFIKPEKVITPPEDFAAETLSEGTNKYGQMLEEALAESNASNPAAAAVPTVSSAPEINGVPEIDYLPMPGDQTLPPPPTPPIDFSNLAPAPAPAIPETPAMPEAPAPMAEPAATPTIEITSTADTPVAPELGAQPAMQDQVYGPQAASPDSFKIPGNEGQ